MSENQPTFQRSPHDKRNPYTVISNEIIRDRDISPKAKGVLIYLLHLPDDWKINHSHLQWALNIGEDYLNSAMKELLDAGYAKRTRKKVKGLFQPYTYEISELKRFLPDGENRPGSTGPENPVILSTKSSLSEKIGTTTNKSKVVVFSFEKEVFQEELIRIQKMKEALDQRASEWGEEFIIPEQVYVDLSRRYGIEYLIAQFNYMCKLHHNYFKKRNSAYPLEKPIKKPETYFKLACQKNYAGYKS